MFKSRVSNNFNNADDFRELSENELENVSGGHSHHHHHHHSLFVKEEFLFQQIDIQAFTKNQTNSLLNGNSASKQSEYNFSKTTIEFNFLAEIKF